jgi:hypothetical protein
MRQGAGCDSSGDAMHRTNPEASRPAVTMLPHWALLGAASFACSGSGPSGVQGTVHAEIVAPDAATIYREGDTIRFAASVVDPDGSPVEDGVYQWRSDRDGTINERTRETTGVLSAGVHAIVFTAWRNAIVVARDTVTIHVERNPAGRAFVDRPDEREGALVHVVYLTPLGAVDRLRDVDGSIDSMVVAMQDVLRASTGHTWRLDTHDGGALDVTYLRLLVPFTGTYDHLTGVVQDALTAHGLLRPGRHVLAVVEASGAALGISGVAGGATALQFTDYLQWRTATHELLHLIGVGHTTVPHDLMNNGPTGGSAWDPGQLYGQLFLASAWVE